MCIQCAHGGCAFYSGNPGTPTCRARASASQPPQLFSIRVSPQTPPSRGFLALCRPSWALLTRACPLSGQCAGPSLETSSNLTVQLDRVRVWGPFLLPNGREVTSEAASLRVLVYREALPSLTVPTRRSVGGLCQPRAPMQMVSGALVGSLGFRVHGDACDNFCCSQSFLAHTIAAGIDGYEIS